MFKVTNCSNLKNNPDETEEKPVSKRGKHTKYLPYVFTQEGVAALSGVLRSPIAIQVNISIMRAFVALRQMITGYQELLKRIEETGRKVRDAQFSGDIPSTYPVIKPQARTEDHANR